MAVARTDFPYRHATRSVNAFQLRVGTAGLKAMDYDFAAAVLFTMIYRQALRAPAERRVSINGIATSLKQSTETMRRASRVLIGLGVCRPVDRGVERTPGFFDLDWVRSFDQEVDDAFSVLLDGLRSCGFDPPTGLAMQTRAARIEAALDIQLSVHELDETRNSDLCSLHIIGTVVVLNAARLTADTLSGLALWP